MAIDVPVEHIVLIDRGFDYANKVNMPEVWNRPAKTQLDGLRIKDSMDSYIKAEDPANFAEVIKISNHAGKHDLVRFLQTARKYLREPRIETELAHAYAKTNCLHDAEDFLSMMNVADVSWTSFTKLPNYFSASQIWLFLLPHLYTWARTKQQSIAHICGLNIMVRAKELPTLLTIHERRGHFDEVLSLLEAGLSLERAHMGVFIELGILYSKY
ncbi:hypothetical protein PILCRDRAFT_15706 [Piloderma croceum F 1598]|uniref:Uncharacterized protein n=1 Tax=Piloderma croceum (strain F 1598) TaxID=765440 RepID=A0A0C3AGF6_PILCF|nr:hypothetical protein PILCRDRAFT_15706 [Piloderma croceum F 1598]